MHLINVESVLTIEASGEFQSETEVLKRFSDSGLEGLEYAILSHCWSTKEGEEIGFEEMMTLGKKRGRGALQERQGYKKIVGSCNQARHDGLLWLWVDTCCIDEPERAEALKLMYKWYQQAKKCYAYLHDLVGDTLPTGVSDRKLRWFFRGWTLQELVAPRVVLFFNQDWDLIGDKGKLRSALTRITKIPEQILAAERFPHPDDPCRPSAAQIMSWAADRKTTKTEDRAYSLMGLFEVHMEMKYGEREGAFYRLQEAILGKYNDHSIFAWFGKERPGNVLANDPSDFRDSADVLRMDSAMAFNDLTPEAEEGIRVEQRHAAVRLLITRCLGSSYHFLATLACCRKPAEGRNPTPLTIILAFLDRKYYRAFGDFKPSNEKELRKVYLFCRPTVLDPYFTFEFKVPKSMKLKHDLLQHGDNSPQLPGTKDEVIHYVTANSDKFDFVISVGWSLGRDWVHVVPSGGSSVRIDDGEKLYHVNRIAQLRNEIKGLGDEFPLLKHAHIPRTIQAVVLEYKRQPGRAFVELKVISCTGCCVPIWRPHRDRDMMDDRTTNCFEKIRMSYFSLYGVPTLKHSSTVVRKKSDLEHQQRAILKSFAVRIPLLKELPAPERLLIGERARVCELFKRTEEKKHLEAEALVYEKLGISITRVMSKVKDQLLERNPQAHRTDGNAIGVFACPDSGSVGQYILELHEKTNQLRVELDSAENNIRKQALEEDIVGRILLLSRCGLEATQVNLEGVPPEAREKIHRTSVSYLLRNAFMETTDVFISLDGQCPLERVMADAAAGIFKSGLLDDCDQS